MRLLRDILIALPLAATSALHGQSSIAPTYEARYREIRALAPTEQAAVVSHLTLTRDVASWEFESGKLYRLTPVGGRTVGLVFEGAGTFRFTPPTAVERVRMTRFFKSPALEWPFQRVILLFADSTLQELEGKLAFAAAKPPSGLADEIHHALDFLGNEDRRAFDPDLMGAFLNGESNPLFYAHIMRENYDPVMFYFNPWELEGVRLWSRIPHANHMRRAEVVTQFPARTGSPHPVAHGERWRQAEIRKYVIDTDLPETGIGDLDFRARATMDITTDQPLGPWVAFWLFEKVVIDSARGSAGEVVDAFKGKDDEVLWLNLGTPLAPGETRTVTLGYHGNLIDRYGDLFAIKSSVAWYPRSLEGRSLALFDLTYHIPRGQTIASVGDKVDSNDTQRTRTSRWITPAPIRNAGFNVGVFDSYTPKAEGIPPVTILGSETENRKRGRGVRERVAIDFTRSLQFFQHQFGPLPVKHLFATEIPYRHGEAFDGLILLSWVTFQQTSQQGFDEVFRAHEIAHQWWGIGVDFTSYHDQWLSEGFSDFAGLWFLQTARGDNDKYFDMLRRWRTDVLDRRAEPGPIWLGYRTRTANDPNDYDIVVYKKGAWVLHMLRTLMLDLKTMGEERFTGLMHDFYTTYQGKRASTEDFRRMVEQKTGQDMGWFFDEWVYGADIPTYRVAWRSEPVEGGQFRVVLRVEQTDVPPTFLMYVPVSVDLGDNHIARFRVKVTGARSEIPLAPVPTKPRDVKFNDLEGVLADVKQVAW